MIRHVTFKGNKLTLAGIKREEDEYAPDSILVDRQMNEVRLSSYKDKVRIQTSFLSLDTPVCEMQVKDFNKKASSMSKDVVILALSKDLPFAQQRFCQANEIKDLQVLSDYRYSSYGMNYGLLVKELNLLARSVVIVDKNNIIRYIQIVDEMTRLPDLQEAMEKLEETLKNPFKGHAGQNGHCLPCEKGGKPLNGEEIDRRLSGLQGWENKDNIELKKNFRMDNFLEAKELIDEIAFLAQEQGHHPALKWNYNNVKISLTTHSAGGVTENDFIMARFIDRLATKG